MKSFLIFSIILLSWAFFAPGCMTFRKPDSEMKAKFDKAGVQLLTGTLQISGKNMHYAMTGSDSLPTLIFIHGTPGSWDAFAGYMQDKELLNKYRMISIDRPGFGYSDFGKSLHLSEQSVLLNAVAFQLKNGKPSYLVGHSLGGPLLVLMAADQPTYYQGLVMIAGSVDANLEKPEKWRPLLFKTPLSLLVPGAFRPSNLELWYLKKDLVDLKARFSEVRAPVYFIHGLKDTWVPAENVTYASQLLVNASKIDSLMIADGNHFIPWTKYDEIRKVLLELDGIYGRPASLSGF